MNKNILPLSILLLSLFLLPFYLPFHFWGVETAFGASQPKELHQKVKQKETQSETGGDSKKISIKKNKQNTSKSIETLDFEFVYLDPKNFTDHEVVPNEKNYTFKSITLTKPFYIQTTEVTQRQWQTIMGSNPSHRTNCLDCPVENVSFKEVHSFLDKLNNRGHGFYYRLPTQVEWLFTVQEDTLIYPNGPPESTHFGKDFVTSPVKHTKPNTLGLYGTYQNVWEFIQYDQPVLKLRKVMLQGGACKAKPMHYWAAAYWQKPEEKSNYTGFRLVRVY